LEHEQYITKRINKLYNLAGDENDNPLQVLLQWFINEQVEEEATATNILEKIRLVGEKGTSLYILDRELAERTE
jgi:ferritin